MSSDSDKIKVAKLVKLLTGDKKLDQIANIIDKISVKDSEQIREIVPCRKWVSEDYFIGHDGNTKLYPFWKDLICDIFDDNSGQKYTTVVLTGGIGCRPINSTYYETSDGLLKLSEISDAIKKHDVYINTEVGLEKIVDTHIIGEKYTITLKLSDGTTFTGSADHLLKVFDGEKILFKKLSEISDDDQILKSNKKKVEFNNDQYSLSEAYVTGSILGDGSIRFGWDDTIETSFKEVFPEANVRCRIKQQSGWHYRDICITNREVFDKLFGHVEGCTAYKKEIPAWVFSASDKVKWSFVAGLFDTDGSISKSGDIAISLASSKLIFQLKCLLSSLGVESHTKEKPHLYKGEHRIYHVLGVTNVRSRVRFKENCPLKLKSKRDRLDNVNRNCRTTLKRLSAYMRTLPRLVIPSGVDGALKVYRRKSQEMTFETLCKYKDTFEDWFNGSDVLKYIYDNECSFVTIKERSYSHDVVGDIEVDGSHTYISDSGLINHNTGKSTCGLYILLRKLYELSCYKNVAGLFGMMSNSFTAFLYFSLTKFQAERTGYGQLRSIIDGIPYFNEHFCRNKYRNSTLDFPENVRMFYGASTGDMIGMNVIASILDEANFFGDSSGSDVNYGDVAKLHDSIMSRQSSRYTKNGVNHSLSVVISSSTFQSSYTQQLYEKSLTDSSIKYARARLWDIKPKGTYSDEMFYVFAGNEKFDPFVIDSTADLCAKLGISLDPSLSTPEAVSKLSQEYRNLIDEVPIDFYNIYRSNIIQGLQDFSGLSVSSTGKLFTSRSTFESCIDSEIYPLFSKNEFTVETCNDEPSNCVQYYLNGKEFPHKECPRYIHIDIGVANDAYGIACCYKHGTKLVDGVETPEYYYDFSLRIVPPPAPKRVSISRCHEFIKYMRDVLGLRIGMVSFDQFQSEASRQFLTENGFNVKYQSVDKTDTAYLFFVDCMYKNIVHFGEEFAEAIKKELFDLIWYRSKQKVDHPSDTKHGGMKDRMDGVVGALYNAYITQEAIYDPSDVLNLSKFNSGDLDNYSEVPVDDLEIETGIKRVSLDELEDPYRYLDMQLHV